jgi:predicted ATPase
LAALIHGKTEGNPLFMVDLMRHLRGRQVLALEQSRWVLAQSLPDLQRELPESVRSMIEHKIAQLGEDDRRLLVAASVQGQEFESAVVAQALALDAAEVEEQLERLERVHAFVRFLGEHEFPDRTLTVRYRFVHVLYQNALYASLRPTRRASLSAAVAQALMSHYGEKSTAVASELALLWEAARDYTRAADYFLLAAQNAARIFANQEAVVLALRGLELLRTLPVSPERDRQELALQIALGPPLTTTRGWTSPEVEQTYTRAQALCQRVGETPQLFPAVWGLWFYSCGRPETRTTRELGERLLTLAQHAQDPALLLQAHHALGPTYIITGDWLSARAHLEQGISLYEPQQHRAHAFLYGGHDPGVCCLCHAACSLWMLGYPDQALQRSQEALELARELSHPTTLAHARFLIGMFHQFRLEAPETLEQAEALERLSAEQGFPTYLAGAAVLKGWTLAERGQAEEGTARIRQGLTAWTTGVFYWRIHFLALLAEACGRGGKAQEGLAILADALRAIEETGIRFYDPEIHRLKGELLLAYAPESPADAEACFLQAIASARRQNARSLELRAVLSISRLYHQQGKQEEAQSMVGEIYGWFTEGFETVDLQEAKALLEVIS